MLFKKKKSREGMVRSKGGRQYSTKDYSNPFFANSKKKARMKRNSYQLPIKIKIISILVLIAGISVLAALFYSSFFEIREVIARGGGKINPRDIEQLAWSQINSSYLILVTQKNIFLFNKEKLRRSLELKYSFNTLSINKQLPNTLIVEYEEKKYAIIWQEDENYYYADENGEVITGANILEIENKEYPILENKTGRFIYENKLPISASYIEYSRQLFDLFKEKRDIFKIERYIIDNDVNTVKAKIENGPAIYFAIEADSAKQFNKLLVIKNEKLQNDFFDREYIDVRYGESVYYR